MDLPTQFLQDIANHHLFPADLSDKNLRERIFFPLRFQRREVHVSHQEIAKEMSQTELLRGINCQTAIGTTVQNVIHRIVDVFGEEMAGDGVNTAPLIQRERGKHGAWQEVDQWLWDYKFPRWQLDWIWCSLVQQADTATDWIWFTPVEIFKGLVVPMGKRREQPVIGLNKPSVMQVNLGCNGGHLLLLNRGLNTNYVVCPSQAFAPVNSLREETILLPQRGAMSEDMTFDTPGKEEFLGIVVERFWDFPWLKPNEEEPAPIWDIKRLQQLWESLRGEGNWRGFYQVFEVVEMGSIPNV